MGYKCVLFANSQFKNEMDIYEKKSEMTNPVVIIYDSDKVVEVFDIVAQDLEDLTLMYEKKIFYTSSISKDQYEYKYGAIFYGVEPEYWKLEEEYVEL